MTSSDSTLNNCRLERLGEGGRRHVDKRVSKALTLGRLLEGNGRLADVEVSAVVPAGVELPSGQSLDQGGVMRSGPASECLYAILGETVMRHGYSLVMVDMLARRGDPLGFRRSPHVTHEDEIYYVTPHSPTRTQIEDAIDDARAASGFVGFGFDRATAGLEIEDGTELTTGALERIAGTVEFAVVDAFDGEGYAVGFRAAS